MEEGMGGTRVRIYTNWSISVIGAYKTKSIQAITEIILAKVGKRYNKKYTS